MITIEGVCDQLRRYNQTVNETHTVMVCDDTSVILCDSFLQPVKTFGNPYQLTEFFTKHTGVRS